MRPPMLIGLVVALCLTAWVALQEDDGAVEAVGHRDAQRGSPSASPGAATSARRAASSPAGSRHELATTQLLVRSVAQWQARTGLARPAPGDLQAWASQKPPAPPPVSSADAAPPPPMAPPFPHAWVGRFDDEVRRAVLSSAEATWVVAVGDVVDGQWRVDQIQDRQLGMTYLPLNQHQTVAMKAP